MFYILIVINITLQWSVCSHSLSKENRINDRLSVNCIIDGRDNVFIGCPVIIFKIVPDDNAKAIQMQSGELDLALLTPKDAKTFADQDGYTCYDMKTSDYP